MKKSALKRSRGVIPLLALLLCVKFSFAQCTCDGERQEIRFNTPSQISLMCCLAKQSSLGFQAVGWCIKNNTGDILEISFSKDYTLKCGNGKSYNITIVGLTPGETRSGYGFYGHADLTNEFFDEDCKGKYKVASVGVSNIRIKNISEERRQKAAYELAQKKQKESEAKQATVEAEHRQALERAQVHRQRAIETISQRVDAIRRSQEETQRSINTAFSRLGDLFTGRAQDREMEEARQRDDEEQKARDIFSRELRNTSDLTDILSLLDARIDDLESDADWADEQAKSAEESADDYERNASLSRQIGSTQFGSDISARMNEGYAKAWRIRARAENDRVRRLHAEADDLRVQRDQIETEVSEYSHSSRDMSDQRYSSKDMNNSSNVADNSQRNVSNVAEDYFQKGNSFKDTDWNKAVEYWLLAAQYGHPGCKEWAAKIANENFENGNKVKGTDWEKATEYWLTAARYGHSGCIEWASKNANNYFEKGNAVKDTDRSKAIEYWTLAAKYGHKGCIKWINEEYNLSSARGQFTDVRDKKVYKWTLIGQQKWMAENLDYQMGGSWASDIGRLYTWYSALKACPVGWHLPSNEEWNILVERLGGMQGAGKALKSRSGWQNSGNGTNSTGFGALPAGYYEPNGTPVGLEMLGYWWSSTESDPNRAWFRELFYSHDNIYGRQYDKQHAFSVRCISD